jgi:hypothetical protein
VRPIFLFFLTALPTVSAARNGTNECSAFWSRHPDLVVNEIRLPALDIDGQDYFSETIREIRSGADRYQPANLEESDCLLERILPEKVRAAFIAGVHLATASKGLSANESRERIFEEVNRAIDESASGPDSGMLIALALRSEIASMFGFRDGIHFQDRSPLTKHVNSLGVYISQDVEWSMWMHFADHLGLHEVNYRSVLRNAQTASVRFVPPTQFEVRGCPQPIIYQALSISQPILRKPSSIEDVDHFGICKQTKRFWSWSRHHGWRPLSTQQSVSFCANLHRSHFFLWDAQFQEICESPAPTN